MDFRVKLVKAARIVANHCMPRASLSDRFQAAKGLLLMASLHEQTASLLVNEAYGIDINQTYNKPGQVDIPEFIYITFPYIYLGLLATMPPGATLPNNFTPQVVDAKDNSFTLKFFNNCFLKVLKGSSAFSEPKIDLDFSKTPVLCMISHNGKNYSFDEFKIHLDDFFSESAELWEVLDSLIEKGTNLYRAITPTEWESIRENNGYFLIRERTNFEARVGSQVKHYATEKGYAGIVIRIKVEGPYFRPAGLQVPRIEAVLPHYAKCEVLSKDINGNDLWVSYEEYVSKK